MHSAYIQQVLTFREESCICQWAQSRKRNRKARYRCLSSLGGKFGKRNQGHPYRFLRVRFLKSSVSLPKRYLRKELFWITIFSFGIKFGQRNRRLWATKPKKSVTMTSVTFPKFSSQRRWATIPCLAVSFTWLRPKWDEFVIKLERFRYKSQEFRLGRALSILI